MIRQLFHLLDIFSRVFHHWPPMALLLVATFLAQMGYAMITPTLPLYLSSARIGAPIVALGIVLAVYAISETLFKAVGGSLSDRWGRLRVIVMGLLLGTVGPLLMTVAGRWEYFVPLRALDGLGVALVWPTILALIGDRIPARDRALAMSAYNVPYLGGFGVGMAAGLLIGQVMDDNRYTFYSSSLMLFLAAVCLAFLGWWDRRRSRALGAPPPAPQPDAFPPRVTLWQLWGDRMLRLRRERPSLLHMLWIFALIQGAASLLAPIAPLYARDVLGLSQAGMVRLVAPPFLLAALLAMPLGRLADRWGKPRVIRLGLLTGALAFAAIPLLGTDRDLVAVALAVLALSFLAVLPPWLALTSELAPSGRQGLVIGAMNAAQGLGFIAASIPGAVLYGHVGRTTPFGAAALLLLLCYLLTAVLVRPERHPQPVPRGA